LLRAIRNSFEGVFHMSGPGWEQRIWPIGGIIRRLQPWPPVKAGRLGQGRVGEVC